MPLNVGAFTKYFAMSIALQGNCSLSASCLTKSMLKPENSEKKRIAPTLTVKGFIVYCSNKIDDVEQRFDWDNAFIDAAITSGVTFFSTLGGSSVAELGAVSGLKVAAVAAFTQFFIFLALKRGLVQPKETPTQ